MLTESCVLFFRLPTPLKQNRGEKLAPAPDSVWEHGRLYPGYMLTMGGFTQVTY